MIPVRVENRTSQSPGSEPLVLDALEQAPRRFCPEDQARLALGAEYWQKRKEDRTGEPHLQRDAGDARGAVRDGGPNGTQHGVLFIVCMIF